MGRSFSRSPRQLVASVASAALLAGGLTAIQLVAMPVAASAAEGEVWDNFNGTGNADGSATESGGKTWQALNGTWTRSGGGRVSTATAPGSNPMLVTDLETPDVDARLTTTGASAETLFFRVQDATNWLRVRRSQTQTSVVTYPTEYQHQVYFTDRQFTRTFREYEYNDYTVEKQWQDKTWQKQYSKTIYGSWTGWSTFAQSACQSSAGEVSLPANTDTAQYQLGGSSTAGCSGGKRKWDKQSRTRTKTIDNIWLGALDSSVPSGYSYTGSERYVNVGSPYYGTAHASSGSTWAHEIGSRNVLVGTKWIQGTSVAAPDVMTGNTRVTSQTDWWTLLAKAFSGGYDQPCSYWAANPGTTITCTLTGATRQGDATGDFVWSTTPCAGCPTRTSPTPVTLITQNFHLRLGKMVNGTITNLGIWDIGGPTGGFRVTALGSTINVYNGTGEGSLLGTVTVTDFADLTRHGCGLGGEDLVGPTNNLDYCYLRALTPPKPASVIPPAVSGGASVGSTLTVSNGNWSGSPTSYAYRWLRCDTAGTSCVGINGAQSASYLVAGADAGARLRAEVTATNAGGATTAQSSATAVIATPPPTVVTPPAVTGGSTVGSIVTVGTGTWTGNPTGYTYQWLRCDGDGLSCTPIAGATGASYTITSEDVGARLQARVTAANAAGAADAITEATGPMVASEPPIAEFIVDFQKDTGGGPTAAKRAEVYSAVGAATGTTLTEGRTLLSGATLVRSEVPLGASGQANLVAAFEARSDVAYAVPNELVYAAEEPTDPDYVGSADRQWHYGSDGLRLPHAWNFGDGAGVTVSVIDSGITAHPDLDGTGMPGLDFILSPTRSRDGDGWDRDPTDEGDWCPSDPQPRSSWHGTHVAGTVGARWDNGKGGAGVARSVQLQPIRALGRCNGDTADIVDAIWWASGDIAAGVLGENPTPAEVINLSIQSTKYDGCNEHVQRAFDRAASQGVSVVLAAGNQNHDTKDGKYTGCRNVIVVGASNQNSTRRSSSNHGSEVDISAPGTNIWSTLNNGTTVAGDPIYGNMSGTSQAAPHIAGLIALVKSKYPNMTPAQIESALKASAANRPVAGCSDCGAGIADAKQLFINLAGPVAVNGGLNAMFNGYADGAGFENMCAKWSGGDGTQSIALGAGKRAWFFSDSFMGDTRLRANGFDTSALRNAVVVQDGSSLSPSSLRTIAGGPVCHERDPIDPADPEGSFLARYTKTPYREPSNDAPWYWGADAIVVGGNVVKFWWRNVVAGQLWKETHSAITVQPVSDFDRADFTRIPDLLPAHKPGDGLVPILWGQSLLVEGDDVYVYGSAYLDSTKTRRLFLARTTKANLANFGTWEFRTASGGWSGSQSDAAPVSSTFVAASTSFSVEKINDRYWLFQREPGLNGGDIYAHPASSRSGFTDQAVKLYSAPEGGHRPDDYLFHYDVRVHDGISSDSDDVVLSYNVNTTAVSIGCRSRNAYEGSIYRPRFITVPAERLLLSETETVVDNSSIGFPTPDPLGSGVDNQWFDSWAYSETHCPPLVKSTTLAATRDPSGTGEVTLSWNNYGRDMHYWLYKRDLGTPENPVTNPTWVQQPLWITGTTFTDIPLLGSAYGSTIEYKIRPFASGSFETDLAKKSAPWSNVVSVRAHWNKPAAPVLTEASTPTPKNGTVTVRWNGVTSPNASNYYQVRYWNISAGQTQANASWTGWLGETTRSTVLNLTPGSQYGFYVEAYNAEGISPPSNIRYATP